MDQGRARLGLDARRGLLARRERRLAGDHARAVALDGEPLHGRRVARHHDVRRDAALARRPRERLGLVAGAVRDDAAARDGLVEPRHGVGGAAELEGADLLELLALEEERAAGEAVERRAGRDGGHVRAPGDALGGGADRGEIDRAGAHRAASLRAGARFERKRHAAPSEVAHSTCQSAWPWNQRLSGQHSTRRTSASRKAVAATSSASGSSAARAVPRPARTASTIGIAPATTSSGSTTCAEICHLKTASATSSASAIATAVAARTPSRSSPSAPTATTAA